MKNTWLKRKLKRQLFTMPVTLNADFEIEFGAIRGHLLPALIRYWRWHRKHGSITREAYETITAIILYAYEKQSGETL